MRGRFFRRIGCLFSLLILGLAGAMTVMFILVSNMRGMMRHPTPEGWLPPVGVLIFLIGFIYWSIRGMRRYSMPLGDLLEASERVAEGDYTARVEERGPRELRSLTKAFNTMTSKLQITNEQRRNLLADVTHELRTPLTVIQGNVEGILDGVYTADEAHLKSILEETQVLSRLVDDLRTLALAESGALQLRREPTDLAVLLGETAAAFKAQADGRGVLLAAEGMLDAPLLNLDPERLREVLANLVANALRYTPAGGRIALRLSQDGTIMRVEVADSGPGIPAEDLAYVFNRFYKSSDSGGMGLGLSIAKTLVEAHGGKIRVESQVGQGTAFIISLPVE
jgi:two-component system, OmpR family, sensor histidine kinase BaeS